MRHKTGHFLELGGRGVTMTTIRQLSYPLSLSLITEQNGSHDRLVSHLAVAPGKERLSVIHSLTNTDMQ